MGFIYENVLNWIRREVQQSSASLAEQRDFAMLVSEAGEEVLNEIDQLLADRAYRGGKFHEP